MKFSRFYNFKKKLVTATTIWGNTVNVGYYSGVPDLKVTFLFNFTTITTVQRSLGPSENSFLGNRLQQLGCNTSLNTEIPSPALRGFWWYGIFVFGPFGQLGQFWKKNWTDYEQLLGPFFSCFQGQKESLHIFFSNIVASTLLKSYIKSL